MTTGQIPVNRTLAGILAILLTVAGLVVWLVMGRAEIGGAMLRVGLVLGAFWYALPSKTRDAAWANVSLFSLLVCLVIVVVFVQRLRYFLPLVLVAAVAAYFLRPRKKREN